MSAKELTQTRKNIHGNWADQSALAFALKTQMQNSTNWKTMSATQREALDMIATKISRILSGDPMHVDHWDDIGGYALLGKEGHS